MVTRASRRDRQTTGERLPRTTKEGWRLWAESEPAPPVELLDPDEYDRLAKSKKEADRTSKRDHNLARRAHHANPPFVDTPTVNAVMGAAEEAIELNEDKGNSDFGLAITAEGTFGKTWLLWHIGRKYEKRVMRENPDLAGDPSFWPVVYVAAPPSATPLMMAQQIARFYGTPLPSKGQNLPKAEEALLRVMAEVDTSLVLVDEAHNMDRADSQGRYAGDHMKWLMNQMPGGTTVVYAGIDLHDEGPLSGHRVSQSAGRFTFHEIDPFSMDTPAEAKAWKTTLRVFEDHLRLYQHDPGTLEGLADYVLDRTLGRMGSLAELYAKGTRIAVKEGHERLDQEVMDKVKLNLKATEDAKSRDDAAEQEGDYRTNAKAKLAATTPKPKTKKQAKPGPAARRRAAG